MRGYWLMSAVVVLLSAGCGPARWTLRRSPGAGPASYTVTRTWRADPPDSSNGNQNHKMTVEVESASKSELRIRVLDFEGECVGDPRATKHLKDIRPGILKLVLSRRVGDLGPSSALDVVDGNEAGWAGMMVMKALGVYEFGFTDFVYPDRPVALKDTWTANFDILQEARFGAEVAADVGKHESKAVFRDGTAKVVFRLESVAKVAGRERARVSYRFDQNATYTYEDLLGQAMREAGVRWTQTGEFVVDLGTGWIDAFTADRSVENTYGSEHQKEHTVTEVRLQ